ncbi:MAG: sigma-70 family RNA polymerase sigma factor [Myxococcales bacterium]|nr:sigma-70 family RNA polymerase sigma factor [Myxococcales bacterium]
MTGGEAERTDPAAVARLVEQHRAFLGFLERRLPSAQAAEEVLQAAFVRTMERGSELEDAERVVPWFYRLLRNAIADYYRGRTRERRRQEAFEAEASIEPQSEELRGAVCACIHALLDNLRPEYAELLRRVDLEEEPVKDVAAALHITANNASVRLHRARHALRRELERSCGTCATHACLDCSCSTSPVQATTAEHATDGGET